MADTADVVVRDLGSGDREAALEVLVAAFLAVDFPPTRLIFGTGRKAPARARGLYAMLFEPRSKARILVAEQANSIVGALSYMDSPACSKPRPGQMLTMARIMGPRLVTSARMLVKGSKAHPKTRHRHLPVMGVHPDAQGRGVAGRLLAAFERHCDKAGLDGYLETVTWADTTKPSHRALYERHGFVVSHTVPMTPEWSLIAMTRRVGERSEDGTGGPPDVTQS